MEKAVDGGIVVGLWVEPKPEQPKEKVEKPAPKATKKTKGESA